MNETKGYCQHEKITLLIHWKIEDQHETSHFGILDLQWIIGCKDYRFCSEHSLNWAIVIIGSSSTSMTSKSSSAWKNFNQVTNWEKGWALGSACPLVICPKIRFIQNSPLISFKLAKMLILLLWTIPMDGCPSSFVH